MYDYYLHVQHPAKTTTGAGTVKKNFLITKNRWNKMFSERETCDA